MLLWKNGLEDSVYVLISAHGKFYNEDTLLPKEFLFFFICSGPYTASISNVRLSFNISLFVMPHFKCSFMMHLIFYVWDAIFYYYYHYYYYYYYYYYYFLGLWLVGFDLDWVLWGGLGCGLCYYGLLFCTCLMSTNWDFYAITLFFGYVLVILSNAIFLLLSSRTFSIQSNDQQFTFICRETHFWYILPDEVKSATLLNQYLDILSPCEKENVLRMHGDNLKKSALLARALVRTTIARCMSFLFPLKFLDFVLFYFIFLFIYFLH